jgi:hypothetical protein
VAIRDVLSGINLRCAVAFWGEGAANLLHKCAGDRARNAKIVCDISMGGTSPEELIRLGAPNNQRLRYYDKFHAKVYLSSKGIIAGSANASSNGIAFTDESLPGLIEAGTYHASDEAAWKEAKLWFDGLYHAARTIDQNALAVH